MNKNNISVESLAADEHFQRFCLAPNDSDRRYWENWVVQNTQHHVAYLEAMNLVRNLGLQPNSEEILGELEKLRVGIKETQKPVVQIDSRRSLLRMAAVFLVLMMAVGLWKHFDKQEVEMLAYETAYGKTKEIALSDGSHVILNANSKLQVIKELATTGKREIWLDGEAFFKVAHQNGQPFIVHTQKGDVRVLGTSFNVSQRQTDFEVTLVEGKVQLQLPNDTKINLQPGEQAQVSNQTIDVIKVDTETTAAWRTNRMNFKNIPIRRIITQIENDFGWSIQVENKTLLKRKVNAQIPENNPYLLFEALTAIYDLKIEKVAEGEYIIK